MLRRNVYPSFFFSLSRILFGKMRCANAPRFLLTVLSRDRVVQYKEILSAPDAYSPEKVKLDATPQYSFGIRHAPDKISDTPGNIKTRRFGVNLLLSSHAFTCFVQRLELIVPRRWTWTKGRSIAWLAKAPYRSTTMFPVRLEIAESATVTRRSLFAFIFDYVLLQHLARTVLRRVTWTKDRSTVWPVKGRRKSWTTILVSIASSLSFSERVLLSDVLY